MITWRTNEGNVFTANEGSEVKGVYITYEPSDAELITYVNGVETVIEGTVENPCISGSLPTGVVLRKVRDGRFALEGTLPIENETKTYYFTLRARLIEDGIPEYEDRCFSITVENKKTDFAEVEMPIVFTQRIYAHTQIKLVNAEGNESFIKISGDLPYGLTLSESGLIYGIPDEVSGTEREYRCVIGVKRNGEIILQKEFFTTVRTLASLNNPIWITDSGILGVLSFSETPSSTLMVKAYDPNGLELTYRLADGFNLPDGLKLDVSTGQIKGKCLTQYSRTWEFEVIVSNGQYSASRRFSLVTNEISSDKNLSWDMDTLLGTYRVGENVFIELKTNSNYNVRYTLLSNNLPKGLSFNNGIITGTVDYQPYENYRFAVEANNGYKSLVQQFTISIVKGLGKNSLKCYFYINHEYDDDYGAMLRYFNKAYAYESKNALYKIPISPEIGICTCTCFDKILLSHLLEFNESLDIVWDKTIQQKYMVEGEEIYSAFYKSLHEEVPNGGIETWEGNKVYVTKDPSSSTNYYLEGTRTEVTPVEPIYSDTTSLKTGREYILNANTGKRIYIAELHDYDAYILNIEDNPEKYHFEVIGTNEPIYYEIGQEQDLYTGEIKGVWRGYVKRVEYETLGQDDNKEVHKKDLKLYVTQCENGMLMNIDTRKYLELYRVDTTVYREPNEARTYFIDNNRTVLAMPSTTAIRNELNSTIYVDKSTSKNVLYDLGTQEVIAEDGEYPEYTLDYDPDKGYFVTYNGEDQYVDVYATSNEIGDPTPVYASVENIGWIEAADNKTAAPQDFKNTYDNKFAETVDYQYILDGNLTRFSLVPVKVRIEYLDTEVDYQNYFVFEKGTLKIQEGILFTLAWNPDVKFIILNGQTHIVGTIDYPWIYDPEKNEHIGYDTKIVLPYISDEDVQDINSEKPYVRFFDMDSESLPAWKTRQLPSWKPNTQYIDGDMFQYGGEYYYVMSQFKSTDEFVAYDNFVRTMSTLEKEVYDKPYYFPCMQLFFGIPNSNIYNLQQLNAAEEKGLHWTNRKFCFYEVHFSPIYNNKIDKFAIPFYNYKHNRSPEFQLI